MTDAYDRGRNKKTYSYFPAKPVIKFSGGTAYISSSLGTNLDSPSLDLAILSMDETIFSGSGGTSIITSSNKIVFSGTFSTQTTLLQNMFVKNVTTDISATSGGTWKAIPELSSSLSVSSGSSALLKFSACVTTTNQGFSGFFRVKFGGWVVTGSNKSQAIWNYPEQQLDPTGVNVFCVTLPVTAGVYIAEVEWGVGMFGYTTTSMYCYAGSRPDRYSAWFMGQEVRRV
jgi:hypothetical protein